MGSDEDIEMVESQLSPDKLDMSQIVFLEIRDCDKALGTPEYPERVNALIRKTRTHPKMFKKSGNKKFENNLEEFDAEISGANSEIEDTETAIDNLWNTNNKKDLKKIEEPDFKQREQIVLKWLAKFNVTWKTPERDEL